MSPKRAELHSREVIEAYRAELIRKLREPIDRGAGTFGEDGYRPPMQAEACLSCGSELYGGELPICPVCGMQTPWRQEYGRILEFERRAPAEAADRAVMIRATFSISPTTYTQRLTRMLDDPRALTVDAVTVRRLRRRRDLMSTARVSEPSARRARPMPRQRPLDFPSRPGIQSPASVLTSTPSGAEGTAESSAAEVAPDRVPDDTAAAGDTFFLPGGRTHPTAPAGKRSEPAGDTSEGVRARVENDRVWGRRDRLQLWPRPLGHHLHVLLKRARDLWRGIC